MFLTQARPNHLHPRRRGSLAVLLVFIPDAVDVPLSHANIHLTCNFGQAKYCNAEASCPVSSFIYSQFLHRPLKFPSPDAGARGAACRPSASRTTDSPGPVLDNSSLHQLHQELLLFRYVVSPGLQGGGDTQVVWCPQHTKHTFLHQHFSNISCFIL